MNGISYQNKDIVSKTMAENFKNKSLKVYGLDLPKIVQVLPTNLPAVSANELRIDNLFLLEDGTIAIIDYESVYNEENKVKYLNYVTRVVERYKNEGRLDIKIRMIVIYTADIKPEDTTSIYDAGAIKLEIESAYLSKLDSEGIKNRLKEKVTKGEALTEEELMEFIILPLTIRDNRLKKTLLKESIELAKEIKDEQVSMFVLSGILVFSDKIIDEKTSNEVKEWIKMTKVAKLFEKEKEEALAEKDAIIATEKAKSAEKDEALAEKNEALAEKDARIAELEAMLKRA